MSEAVKGTGPVPDSRSIEVRIYGRTYHLRGAEDGAYLQELAKIVDRKMQEVADATGTADTLKIAILACLNIADEFLQASDKRGGADPRTQARMKELAERLEAALAE